MKKASITEAKNNLSALIDSVKGGSPVLIVDRGRPVARLEDITTWMEGCIALEAEAEPSTIF
jgi:prevent-host-death family protein